MQEYLTEIELKIQPYLKEMDLELVDVEYVKDGGYNYLRIYIEKENETTSLNDCILFSEKIEDIVDEIIKDKFYLEVSTPGIERNLKKEKDFLRFLKNNVSIKTKSNIEGKKKFDGVLINFIDNKIIIVDEELKKEIEIPLEKLKQAKLKYVFSENIFKEEK